MRNMSDQSSSACSRSGRATSVVSVDCAAAFIPSPRASRGRPREGRARALSVDLPKELSRWQRAGDPRLFKLIVSPEAGSEIDLREHARAVMRDVERDLGTPLEWMAIDHHNTDHPHVHIVLRRI